jgi:hypothetical protein
MKKGDPKYFHSEAKGCKIKDKVFERRGVDGLLVGTIQGSFCKTHQANLCHCGWQWYWHYGTYSYPRKQTKVEQKNN